MAGTEKAGTGEAVNMESFDNEKEEHEQRVQTKAEMEEKARGYLRSPLFLHIVLEDIKNKGLVGQEGKTALTFVLAASCRSKKDYPHVYVTGDSASGKTELVSKVLSYLPRDWWERTGRLSPTALDHLKLQTFNLLWIQEQRGGKEASESIRLSSVEDGGTEAWVVQRDEKTGRFTTDRIKLPGRSIWTTTIHTNMDSQDATRNWIISIDESHEQTDRILNQQANEFEYPIEYKRALKIGKEDHREVIKEALRLIDWDHIVIIPFAKEIKDFIYSKRDSENRSKIPVRARRDFKRFCRLIRTITLLHQNIRPSYQIEERKFLMATPEDVYIAIRVAGEEFQRTTMSLDKREQEVLDCFEDKKEFTGKERTKKNIADFCNKSTTWANYRLESLEQKGYIYKELRGNKNYYTLLKNGEDKSSEPSLSESDSLEFSILEKKVLERLNLDKNKVSHYHVGRGIDEIYDFEYWDVVTGRRVHPISMTLTQVQIEEQELSVQPKEDGESSEIDNDRQGSSSQQERINKIPKTPYNIMLEKDRIERIKAELIAIRDNGGEVDKDYFMKKGNLTYHVSEERLEKLFLEWFEPGRQQKRFRPRSDLEEFSIDGALGR